MYITHPQFDHRIYLRLIASYTLQSARINARYNYSIGELPMVIRFSAIYHALHRNFQVSSSSYDANSSLGNRRLSRSTMKFSWKDLIEWIILMAGGRSVNTVRTRRARLPHSSVNLLRWFIFPRHARRKVDTMCKMCKFMSRGMRGRE